MVRAQAEGVIDWSKYRRYDISSNIRSVYLLRHLEQGLIARFYERRYQSSLISVLFGIMDEEALRTNDNASKQILKKLASIESPWIDYNIQTEQDMLQAAEERWKRHEEYKNTDEYKAYREKVEQVFKTARENAAKKLELEKKIKEASKNKLDLRPRYATSRNRR